MTAYILVFLFTLADGRQITATQDATHLEEYSPVRTLRGCQQVADVREARMNRGFVEHPGLVQSVRINCVFSKKQEKRSHYGKTRKSGR